MVWAAFFSGGKLRCAFLEARQNRNAYYLLLRGENFANRNYIFQQDNPSIRSAKYTKNWFEDDKISTLN